jgi:hypothetical protein
MTDLALIPISVHTGHPRLVEINTADSSLTTGAAGARCSDRAPDALGGRRHFDVAHAELRQRVDNRV